MSSIEGRAIEFPFAIDASGKVSYNENNDSAIWADRVRYVLLTYLGEKVMQPDFGSRLSELTFENSFSTSDTAKKMVLAAFTKWLPKLKLNNVTVAVDDINGGINLEVDYTLPSGESQAFAVNTLVFNRYGEVIQGG